MSQCKLTEILQLSPDKRGNAKLMQRICGGYLRHYHANIYVMKHFVIPEITKLRMKKYTSGRNMRSIQLRKFLLYPHERCIMAQRHLFRVAKLR